MEGCVKRTYVLTGGCSLGGLSPGVESDGGMRKRRLVRRGFQDHVALEDQRARLEFCILDWSREEERIIFIDHPLAKVKRRG